MQVTVINPGEEPDISKAKEVLMPRTDRAVFDAFDAAVKRKKDELSQQGFDPDSFGLLYRIDRDDNRIYVDGTLLDILYYGQADYGFGKDLYLKVWEAMDRLGYYLDFEHPGVIVPCEV